MAITFQVESVDEDALGGRLDDVLLAESGDGALQDHRVQRPAPVRPRHLLAHGRQKALRIEETRHPKLLRLALDVGRSKRTNHDRLYRPTRLAL